jgi:hypothetical protein
LLVVSDGAEEAARAPEAPATCPAAAVVVVVLEVLIVGLGRASALLIEAVRVFDAHVVPVAVVPLPNRIVVVAELVELEEELPEGLKELLLAALLTRLSPLLAHAEERAEHNLHELTDNRHLGWLPLLERVELDLGVVPTHAVGMELPEPGLGPRVVPLDASANEAPEEQPDAGVSAVELKSGSPVAGQLRARKDDASRGEALLKEHERSALSTHTSPASYIY